MTDAAIDNTPPVAEEDYQEATQSLWKTYAISNALLRFADIKAAILLAFLCVGLGGVTKIVNNREGVVIIRAEMRLFVLLAALCFVGAIFYCLKCLMPRHSADYGSEESGKSTKLLPLIIAECPNLEAFRGALLKSRGAEAEFQAASEQVYAISQILRAKNDSIFWAITLVKSGMAMLIFSVLMSLL